MLFAFWQYRRPTTENWAEGNIRRFLELPRTCFWWLSLIITPVALNSGAVHGEWVAVEKTYPVPGLQTVYVDPSTLLRKDSFVTLWQLTDYRWMQGGPRSTPRFLSTKTQKQIDCRAKRVRLLAFIEFPLRMGVGKPDYEHVDKETWLPVASGSINEILWKVACERS